MAAAPSGARQAKRKKKREGGGWIEHTPFDDTLGPHTSSTQKDKTRAHITPSSPGGSVGRCRNRSLNQECRKMSPLHSALKYAV